MGQMDKEARLVRSTVPPEERAKVVLDATSRADSVGQYLTSRRDLANWHYGWRPDEDGRVDLHDRAPHGDQWELSQAWTHCLCFGAMYETAEPLLEENARLRALLWKVADAPVAGSSETHYAVALTSDLWHEVMDAAGYDEMGQ